MSDYLDSRRAAKQFGFLNAQDQPDVRRLWKFLAVYKVPYKLIGRSIRVRPIDIEAAMQSRNQKEGAA